MPRYASLGRIKPQGALPPFVSSRPMTINKKKYVIVPRGRIIAEGLDKVEMIVKATVVANTKTTKEYVVSVRRSYLTKLDDGSYLVERNALIQSVSDYVRYFAVDFAVKIAKL